MKNLLGVPLQNCTQRWVQPNRVSKRGWYEGWGSTQFLSGTKRLTRESRFKPQRWEFLGEFQRLGLCAFTTKGLGSIPGRGARIPQMVKGSQNKTHRGEGWSPSPWPLPQPPAPVQPKGHQLPPHPPSGAQCLSRCLSYRPHERKRTKGPLAGFSMRTRHWETKRRWT